MNSEKSSAVVSTGKRTYQAPDLVSFGHAKEITRNVNENGPGDAIFSILRHS
jgi:hypothetical protein